MGLAGMVSAVFLQATGGEISGLGMLAQYGAVGILAGFALFGLIATVQAYRRLTDRFIEYLEDHAVKNAEERAMVTGVLQRLVEAVDRIEKRWEQR